MIGRPATMFAALVVALAAGAATKVAAHGDVTPQPVDTTGLDPLGRLRSAKA